MGFTDILNPVLDPMLSLPSGVAIFLISLIITLLITVVYKYTTDQKRMKELKDKLKAFQEKSKKLSKTDPSKAMSMQKEMLSVNGEYMKHSFKSTFYTLIPVLIIFAWLSGNMAYEPLAPGEEFTVSAAFAEGHGPSASLSAIPDLEMLTPTNATIVNGFATWTLRGEEGTHKLTVDYNAEKYDADVLLTTGHKYIDPNHKFQNSKLQSITISNEKVYPIVIGTFMINWFWTYFIFSIALSILIRKLMKVY